MGNEASMEGGGEPGAAGMMGSVVAGGPATGAGAGQHMKPVNGVAPGGGMGVGGPGLGMTRGPMGPMGSPKPGMQQGGMGGGGIGGGGMGGIGGGGMGGIGGGGMGGMGGGTMGGMGGGGIGTGGMGGGMGSRPGEPYRLATHESPVSPRHMQSRQGPGMLQGQGSGHGMVHGPAGSGIGGQGGQSPGQHASRRNLQVDFSGSGGTRTGRSPSVSPDRGLTPTSPYSVPQIAPMPSSKLCPVCTTTELSNPPAVPNYNTCTQCKATVCNQCGFNPNPHLTEVQEWLCLNCQMQRALGIDMTTPRSKSQQQIHSPSHQAKPIVKSQQPSPQATQMQTAAAAAQPKSMAQSQAIQRQQQQPQQQPQQQQPQSMPYSQTQSYSKSQPYSQSQQYPHSQPQPHPQSYPAPHSGTQTQPHTSPGLQGHPSPGGPKTQTGPLQQSMRSDPYPQRGSGAAGAVGGPMRGPNQTGAPRIPHPGAVPLPGLTKAPSQPDLGRSSPMHQSIARHHDQTRSAGSSPAHKPQSQALPPAQDGLTKLFGFGASLLNQASTLINVDPLPTAPTQPSPARGKVVFSNATPDNRQQQQGVPGTKPFGMGGSHTPTPMGSIHAQSQMLGPHAPSQMKGPHEPNQMGSPHTLSQKGSPYPTSQLGGPQMSGPHAPTLKQQIMPHQQGMPQQQLSTLHQKGQLVQQNQPTPAQPQKARQKQELKETPMPAPEAPKPKVNCPLCKTELNIGSSEPPNYNSCTQCQSQVCNLCGFNPTPHLVEKKEWLCLNCQTLRLMSGGDLDDASLPVPHPSPKNVPTGLPRHQAITSQQSPFHKPSSQQGPGPVESQTQKPHAGSGKSGQFAPTPARHLSDTKTITPTTTPMITTETQKQPKSTEDKPKTDLEAHEAKPSYKKGEQITPIKDIKRSRHYDDTKNNSSHDLSRSPQSLSDTGYSSDGISSSHSEITGLIQEEEMKLSERGISARGSPPSPSEITKLESSMRPLLEKSLSEEKVDRKGKKHRDLDERGKLRPRSLSIPLDAYDSDEELEDILEEEGSGGDWETKRKEGKEEKKEMKKREKDADSTEMTDEEFMRRQIMEMSADEENEEDEMEDEGDEEDEGYGYQKPKKSHHKHTVSDSGKEKRRLQHHSSSFEEETKSSTDVYKGSVEEGEEDVMASQGGLRRFKTIELNNTNSYSRDMELSSENDLSLDREEPELEMESLTGSPEERSRGEYSSTLPATSSSYGSGQSPTSISSMEEDSDSSPSRKQRLEEAKQQRKARHRSHGPLLPTIEDSSEEDELREEEELLREQEKMREVEQQRIRSTARKTKRDKEELRAQRRRERSKTPPSNLSPIEDASPTEELRQAAEMEELHRSSASEYSPQSLDSEAEGYESKIYKSGSEYNLPTFMSLYSPVEICSTPVTTTAPTSTSKPLKSAEEVYEEMMRKAEMLQKQQKQQQQQQPHGRHGQYYDEDINGQVYEDEYEYEQDQTGYDNEGVKTETDIYEEIRQTSQNITKMQQATDEQVEIEIENSYTDKQFLDTGSAFAKLLEQSNALLTPGTSPTQISAPVSFAETGGRVPDVRVTQHFSSKDGHKDRIKAGKNGITPTVAATTIAAYGVYARDAVTISQTSSSHTMTSTPSGTYGRHTGSPATSSATVSSVCSKIAEITQAYSQREVLTRRVGETRGVQVRDTSSSSTERIIEPRSPIYTTYYRSTSPPLSPSPPPQSPTCSPSRRATAEFSTQTFNSALRIESVGSGPTSPVMAQGTQTSHRSVSPRIYRQQSSQDAPYSPPASPARPMTVNTATSPLSSPTQFSRQSTFDTYSPCGSPPDTPPYQQPSAHSFYQTQRVEKVNVGTSMVTTASTYTRGSVSMDNISLCRISTVPGTSRVEQGHMIQGGSVVDLRTCSKPTPIIITDQGMDLTSLATESRKYYGGPESKRHSTIVQPLIMNLNTQETTTPTTVSVTVAASMFMSQPRQPTVYGDPHQSRMDLGKGIGSAVCPSQNKSQISPPIDQSIPKIDARLEDLSVQQRELQKQQEKLQKQQELLEQQLMQHHHMQHQQQAPPLARYNLAGQQSPLLKKDLLVSQTSTASAIVSAVSPVINPELYGTGPIELKGKPSPPGLMSGGKLPHSMVVQMDGGPADPRAVTQLVKIEQGQDAMDLIGSQIKSDNQPACCDVYRLPFGGSCVGVSEKDGIRPSSAPPLSYDSDQERQPTVYHEYPVDGCKEFTLPFPGRLQPSISDTNLAEDGLHSYHSKLEPHMQASAELGIDVTAMKQGYGGYMGMQYGSYTDLRHGGDITAQTLPIRRYNSLSNISTDYGYSAHDIASFHEANLAQYSATTAREISRMCAALNSMDRYGSNPDLMHFGSLSRGTGSGTARLAAGLGLRQNLLFGLDGKPMSHSQALTNLINARQASLRAMYPAAVRSSDGMIYSTIQTPIASTLPITTQPASVLHPLLRGVSRPHASVNMAPVPLSSLSRLSMGPRMPLSVQIPVRYPTPGILQTTSTPSTTLGAATTSALVDAALVSLSMTITSSTVQDQPVYLGKGATVTSAEVTSVQGTVIPMEPQQQPINLSQAHLNGQQQQETSAQQPQQPPPAAHAYPQSAPSTHGYTQPPLGPSAPSNAFSIAGGLPPFPPPGAIHKEGETEAERLHRQQEQLLQMERERVELEKLRQLRLHEELERERIDLKLHREKEQMLVQRELQELQNIKDQVLHQQQQEREKQLVLQREQLAQQKSQLDQIQSLQNQLQQQLEEQKRQKTAAHSLQMDGTGQPLHPYIDSHIGSRSLPSSSSEMCLRNQEEYMETRSNIRKHSSMTRLSRDSLDGDAGMFYGSPRRIMDSCVQTDDEDREERYMMRHRTRRRGRSVDCSVQTDDDEDKVETEQPVRRRRSRFSRHSESNSASSTTAAVDSKTDTSKVVSSSIAIQTIREMSCQTEVEHLGRVSPAIHVTVADPNKVEIVHYISGPERTPKGQSLACQTDSEAQSHGIVAPQLSVPTTVSPYSSSTSTGTHQSSSVDLTQQRQQQHIAANAAKFERRRPDPLDINYQPHNHLHNESISSIIRQQQTAPKSPQVLYSPVSPVSPHRLLETSLSSERLNKAHVTPQQKSYTVESPQRHPSLPRPIKSTQRSMSDPKPLSPTTDEHTKARLSLYQHQALQSQLAALHQSSLLRKVKRTLPSPPPDETTTSAHLPMMTPALQQVYLPSVPSLKPCSRSGLAAKASLLKDLTHELKAVEQESTKLRKQQAELEEEEKEIDAKLRYLELGIHQRKETLVKERERRDIAYLRCMGDTRDYMSDSELNNLRLAAAAASHETNGLLSTRPSTAPLSQFTSDLHTTAQYPPTTTFLSSQYPQSQPAAATQQSSLSYQSSTFNQPPYPTVTQSQALPQPTPLQSHVTPPGPSYHSQTSYPTHSYPQTQPPYPQTDIGLPAAPQPQPGFGPAPPGQPPYPTHSSPYPSAVSSYPNQTTPFPGQPQVDILSVHPGRPRQTSIADLEHKMPTNYETISNPTVVVTTTAQDATYSSAAPSYGQYTGSTTMANSYAPYGSAPVSSSYGGYSTMPPSSYGQYTSTSASSYGPYTTTTANTYGYTTTSASSYGQYTSTVSNAYGHSVDSPSTYSTAEAMYGAPGLEQSIPRNYMMIDDVSELTAKEGLGTTTGDMMHHGGSGRYPGDIHGHTSTIGSATRGGTGSSSYGRAPEEEAAVQEELYDHHGRGKSSYRHGLLGGSSSSVSSSTGGGSPYYYDNDYKYGFRSGVQKPSSSSRSLLAPAVMSSKRSKHRKLGSMEQKISKFSPIEEARDVEADLASYSSTTGGAYPSSHIRGRQLIEDYGFKKTAYKAGSGTTTHGSRHYGSMVDEDDRIYYTSTGRSRSTGYGMDKISARDYTGYRSRSYERDDRSYRSGYSSGRHPTRQISEEESPLSPLGRFMGSGRSSSLGSNPYDSRSSTYQYYYGQYGSSHSLPDVQDHIRDLPRTHVYKSDDTYIIDDYHCAVSDSEACMPLSPNDMEIDCDLLSVSKAYHLGQEETDWFEKPRSSSRHYGSSHSSGRSRHGIKHTYHDYDEPPEEDLWPQDEYGHGGRHSSSSRDNRQHGSSSRHSSSSRHTDEPRSSRSSKGHPKDPSVRHDPSVRSSSSGRRGDSRSGGYHSSDYSRDQSGHHHSQRSSRQGDPHRSSRSKSQQAMDMQGQPGSSRSGSSSSRTQGNIGGPTGSVRQIGPQTDGTPGQRTQLQQQVQSTAARVGQPAATAITGTQQQLPAQGQGMGMGIGQGQAKPGQIGPVGGPMGQARQTGPAGVIQPTMAKIETPPVTAIGAKAAPIMATKSSQPPLTGIGSKAAPRPGGIGSAAAGQPGMEGDSMLSKILPGGAAEQAGKLGEAISGFGKKFTSFF